MNSLGPLSWQQATCLRRNRLLGLKTGRLVTVVPVPADEPLAALRDRLSAMVAREEALRVVRLPADVDGSVTYADAIDVPISTLRADSAADLAQLFTELGQPQPEGAAGPGGPLWRVVAVEHPDHSGRRTRSIWAALHHLIADPFSLLLFRDELAGRGNAVRTSRRGGYREWIEWQRRTFPMDNGTATPSAAREFWRRYFDGGSPNHAVTLPFCQPTAPVSGVERDLIHDLPVPSAALRAAAARLRSAPLLLVVASVAAAVGALTREADVTLRYVGHGRVDRYLETLGWFADDVPLRIRGPSLTDPHGALRAATLARQQIREYESTPWGYIMQACGQTDAETPQVVLSLIPADEVPNPLPPARSTTLTGGRGDLHITVSAPRTRAGRVRFRFDPHRFAGDGVEGFARTVFARLTVLVEGAG